MYSNVPCLLLHSERISDPSPQKLPFFFFFHFVKHYPLSNVPLREGRTGTAWEPSSRKFFNPL
jgi:hypothetical protein